MSVEKIKIQTGHAAGAPKGGGS